MFDFLQHASSQKRQGRVGVFEAGLMAGVFVTPRKRLISRKCLYLHKNRWLVSKKLRFPKKFPKITKLDLFKSYIPITLTTEICILTTVTLNVHWCIIFPQNDVCDAQSVKKTKFNFFHSWMIFTCYIQVSCYKIQIKS